MNTINERISALRELMQREHLSAFIFPSTDPHNSEYVADHWKGREWISGFNGSAGTAVVTMTGAALWTDSRYFIAAAEQLDGTGFELMKLRMPGTPSVAEWLAAELSEVRSPEIGVDGSVNSYAEVEALIGEMRKSGGITVRTNLDPLEELWTDRPAIPQNEVVVHPMEYAGETASSKIERIRKALRAQHADGILVTALDDIAWTLNLRGSDVHCNPVFVAYLLISTTKATLFVDGAKLTSDVETYLKDEGIAIRGYDEVKQGLANYEEYNILLDADAVNYTLAKCLKCPAVVYGSSPIPALKAVKNETEIKGFRNAMIRDGVAMVKFLKWLKPAVEAGGETEMSLDAKLTGLRAEQALFKGISFDTIVGYEAHGAIVHYEATPETDIPVLPKGLVLIDSGAQYLDGTTDITRTIALGPVTDEQKKIYTLVLKGHIQLDLCKFPSGACGSQIDAFARGAMWREGYNFMHGTGHGVGSYLNVHEGPHQIRMEWRPAPLVAGMTVTNEPGIYLEDKFGVRIENTLLIKPYKRTEFGDFLQFESLTLAPIDLAPIDFSMLTDEEIQWLKAYHQRVYDTLSPHLTAEESEWLKAYCRL
ncbi:aminopeptidase P family protein [Prevotella sp. HUN102]|uniref:aminopeptidase P family protein n=1 Tax=Prevotella sp. HUN102 TaxID=1392486 RepID=UPI00049153F2|nr:aminopeptidase P family protein [Prevotella sp. HUN102]